VRVDICPRAERKEKGLKKDFEEMVKKKEKEETNNLKRADVEQKADGPTSKRERKKGKGSPT
jgi:mRNA-degrading endonuclease RelE of RelBE toxin-antitoxin system